VGEDFEAGADGAPFGVVCAIDKPGDAGLNDGAGAHAAGFDGDVEGGVGEAVVAEQARSFAENDDFGVGGGIAIANGAIAGTRKDLAVVYEHSADRDFAGFGCGTRFCESFLYELDVSFYRAGGHI